MEPNFKDMHVAYFTMELGIEAGMLTYSGGLGTLAGDMLRSAADHDIPLVGLTLLYKKGYFRQKLDSDGNQSEEDAEWDYNEYLKMLPNRVKIHIEDREVTVGCWLYKVRGITGRVNPVLLLDTDLDENSEEDRGITQHLYGGDKRYRLAQEMVLGIAGVKMLENIGCDIQKYHMNEGHSALLVLELAARSEAEDVVHDVRKKCVFTTHTPVASGHDAFDKELSKRMLGSYILDSIKDELFYEDKLNMTYLGLRFSRYVNGVAKKHGEISREMFPGYHIDSITNGIHSKFWTSEPFRELYRKYIPSWGLDTFSLRYMLAVPKTEIWEAHMKAKKTLLDYVNKKYDAGMDPEVFTIGFARRAATYKRGLLLFSDIQRLMKIGKQFKFQIIYGGKAHPRDEEGKNVIRSIVKSMAGVKDKIKVCYLENYDMGIAKKMISGVDVWLNTPLRPKEASGTSGMKAAHNGVPHFSILDGWWLEGHIEDSTGWSIGAHPGTPEDDKEDAEDLYTKLEYVILPKFYNKREDWIEVMRHAIAMNGSFFNTHRMVQQYVSNAYFK